MDYYERKYPSWQRTLVATGVDEVFSNASPADRQQAVLETLAFFHVVYHPTRSHRIENNLALVARYREEIGLACDRFGVPRAMATAILTWENSGSESATSYAACVGMGQLSDGALQQAHRMAARFARVDLDAERFCAVLADIVDGFVANNPLSKGLRARAEFLAQRVRELDLPNVHARLARQAKVKDERAVPRANIEDSVVYMRYLLEMFGGRADIAISAYHNGVSNTDDLLRDYLRRVEPASATFTLTNRAPLLAAMQRRNISYVTLWNDLRCHQMLNGLRTMDGDVTTPYNAREAMGDESDIYVWKTLGALAGTRARTDEVVKLADRYRGEQSEVETSGFRPGKDLVRARGLVLTRELAGYLHSLERRLQSMTPGKKDRPVVTVTAVHRSGTHDSGIAVDITVSDPNLAKLINEDWLFDRIYKTRLPDGRLHICINPRYGQDYLARYQESRRSPNDSAAR